MTYIGASGTTWGACLAPKGNLLRSNLSPGEQIMEFISIAQILETFVSAVPMRERAFLTVALLLSTIAWVFHRKLQLLPTANQITGAGAAARPRLDDALVAFFARSNVSSGTLGVLSAARKPLGFKSLTAKMRRDGNWRIAGVPSSAIRAVLSNLQVAQLVRMRGARFLLTPLGREVQRRIEKNAQPRDRFSVFSTEAQLALS